MKPRRAIRVLAWTHIVIGALGLPAGAFLCMLLQVLWDPASRRMAEVAVPYYLIASLVYLIPGIVGGVGLLRGQAGGWRLIAGLSVLYLPLVPLGTVLGGIGLWVLFARADPAFAGGDIEPRPSLMPLVRGLVVALSALAILAAIVGLGYVFRDQIPVRPPNPFVRGVIIVVGGCLVALVLRAFERPRSGLTRADRKRIAQADEEHRAAHRRRLQVLAADPVRRKYAERMEQGEFWSDEQIAYDLDPIRAATCPHLAPVERALRADGLAVRLLTGAHVTAPCRLDVVALGRAIPLPATVRYSDDIPMPDRSPSDPTASALLCDPCGSGIRVVHPNDAKPATPWFPRR